MVVVQSLKSFTTTLNEEMEGRWKMNQRIGTWEIIGFLENIVLANDPDSPCPYVTWFYNGTDVESGNYFKDKYDAVKDLIERSGYGY